MAARINLLKKSELPAPHEKMLRAPTLFERYGWIKWFILFILVVAVLDFGIINYLNAGGNKMLPSQQTTMAPTSAPLPTTNPTQNWNLYNNPSGKFSFKYPDGYTVKENASRNSIQLASNMLPNNTEFLLTISFKPVTGNTELQTLVTKNPFCPTIFSEKPTPSTINGQQSALLYDDLRCGKTPTSVIYTVNHDLLYIMTVQSENRFEDIKVYTDQIFSTLTFSQEMQEQNPSEQSFCTQDAKQCSDGSWVGRTGPRCEFVCPK